MLSPWNLNSVIAYQLYLKKKKKKKKTASRKMD